MMLAYIIKRLAMAAPVLLGVSIVSFALIRLVPGDTVTAMLGMHYDAGDAEALRREHGLDRPLPVQYMTWVSRIVRGDLGQSAFTGRPVWRVILERLPVTLELAGLSLLLGMLIGIPLGTWSALHRARAGDYAASVGGLLGISIPGFWLGTILILVFSLQLGWLPSGGFRGMADDLWENIRHMLLPALALGTAVAAVIMRMTRSSMLEVIRQDYVRTAHAKGLSRGRVVFRHALRNALVPVVTIAGLQAGYLLGGSVVIEEVFSLPGIGRLVVEAIGNRDYPLLQGLVLFIATAFVLINLLVDVLYCVLDPRIAYAENR